MVKTEIRLWYFCGQTRNRRGKNHGDFHFGGPNRDRTDDLTDANRTLSQLSYGPIYDFGMVSAETALYITIYAGKCQAQDRRVPFQDQ